MANALLDFVMSLVRDPDAAAAYTADPGQAIADAHLTDVTSVDVNNLIPVVSESLSMAVPSTGADGVVDDHASNVWASGAATAAFDAFDDHVPAVAVDEVHTTADHLVTEPDAGVQPGVDVLADAARAHERNRLDVGMRAERIDRFLAAVDDVQHARRQARLF